MLKLCRRFFVWVSVIVFMLTLSNFALSAIERSKKNETYKELDLFADALTFIQSQYVDEAPVKELMYGAMTGMLSRLDPHSQFLTPEEYDELKVDTEGKFGGIGIEITVKDNLITVITPIEGSPAWNAGFEPNDRIVKIDDAVVKNFTLAEAVKRLRGKPGTDVAVIIWREKEGKLHSFKIKRAVIDMKDIREAKIIEDRIGYLKLVEFREDTPQELGRALNDLKGKGMDGLIFDLRNNPGGLLDKAVAVSEMFLPKDSLIVSIKGRDPKQNMDFKANYRSPYLDLPIVLLVNEGSASGSEIMAGALQDHHRAIVLGTKTFGKGSVQTVLPLRDGSALKLTTSRYYTPLGKTIHEKGVEPDIIVLVKEAVKEDKPVDQKEKDMEMIFESVVDQKTEKPAEAVVSPKKEYLSDIPLARAVELLKSIKIYQDFLKK